MNNVPSVIPTSIRSASVEVLYVLKDMVDLLLGRRDPMIPPRRLMFDGPRDVMAFEKNGQEFLGYYIELCNLKPCEHILDVGCGIGRKTVPLTKYLNQDGRYEGFDINRVGVDWCNKNITTRYPNFHFQHIDVYNKRYNPRGRYRAAEFRFPFGEETFDFVVLGSVFTHMLPEDVENYFCEIARVLKRGGRCLISFFLLNTESLELIDTSASNLDFKCKMGKYRVADPDVPEYAVAYDDSYILELYRKYGLINEPIHYGSWCGRPKFSSYQDLIVAWKSVSL